MTQCLFVVFNPRTSKRGWGGGEGKGQMDPHRFFGPKI